VAIIVAFVLSFLLRYAAWTFMTGRRKRKQLDASATEADEVRRPE
jgi:hypothetical protein